MKTFTTLALVVSSIAALAGDASALIFNDGPTLPPGGGMNGGGGCSTPAAASKTFSFDSGNKSDGFTGWGWQVGLAATVGLVADCNKLEASASIGPTVKVFGGAVALKPVDIQVSAATTSGGQNSLAASLYAFGYEVKRVPLATSSQPLEYIESLGYNLPANQLSGTFSRSKEVPTVGGTVSLEVGYQTVANVGVWFIVRVSAANGVEVRTIAAANASASFNATGSYTKSGVNVSLSATTRLDIIRGIFSGRGLLRPSGGSWAADAGAYMGIDDALGGAITVQIPVYGAYTPFSMASSQYGDDWSYYKTFAKPF